MRDPNRNLSPIESYLDNLFPSDDVPLVAESRALAQQLGKSAISLSNHEARIVSTLVRIQGCKKFVEIGTLTGASALWILHGLAPGGQLWTLEKDPVHAEAAAGIFSQYKKLSTEKAVHLLVGDAQEKLDELSGEGPFDGIFIDGNKSAYGHYLQWAIKNLKKNALVLADNVYLGDGVATGNTARFSKKQIEVMREFNQELADKTKFFSCIVPTSDGLFAAIKL